MTVIASIGSKWAGQEPDTIDQLIDVLNSEPLDPKFEAYGNFVQKDPRHATYLGNGEYAEKDLIHPDNLGTVRFWGNFFNVSYVFNIDTDEPDIIEKLTAAIHANQQRADYLALRAA